MINSMSESIVFFFHLAMHDFHVFDNFREDRLLKNLDRT